MSLCANSRFCNPISGHAWNWNLGYRTQPFHTKLDFIQMICAKKQERREKHGKEIEHEVVFGCECETMMLQNNVA